MSWDDDIYSGGAINTGLLLPSAPIWYDLRTVVYSFEDPCARYVTPCGVDAYAPYSYAFLLQGC